jgi:hypothetical protein
MPGLRKPIQSALASCAKGRLAASAKELFNTLTEGVRSAIVRAIRNEPSHHSR